MFIQGSDLNCLDDKQIYYILTLSIILSFILSISDHDQILSLDSKDNVFAFNTMLNITTIIVDGCFGLSRVKPNSFQFKLNCVNSQARNLAVYILNELE